MTLVRADEVMNTRAMEEAGVEPGTSVRIPRTECCGSMPWDCECPSSCVNCREIQRGQGLCGHCHGGRE